MTSNDPAQKLTTDLPLRGYSATGAGVTGLTASGDGVAGGAERGVGVRGTSNTGTAGVFQADGDPSIAPVLIVQTQGAHSGNLLEAQDDGGDARFVVDHGGQVQAAGYRSHSGLVGWAGFVPLPGGAMLAVQDGLIVQYYPPDPVLMSTQRKDSAMQPDELPASDATEGGQMTLTPEDLKQIRNGVISALTHDADVRAFLDQRVRQALTDAGVLTEGNFHSSDAVYDRLKETVYEQAKKAIREAGRAQ